MERSKQREALAVAEQRAAQAIEATVERTEHFLKLREKYGYRTGEELFTAALARVESNSIREWAASDHNRSIWIKIADVWVQKGRNTDDDVHWFSARITGEAIGLFGS